MGENTNSDDVNERFYNLRVTQVGDPQKPIDFKEVKFILNQYKDGRKSMSLFPGDQMIFEVTNSWDL